MIGRQSIQGFLIGVMPGAGATIASFWIRGGTESQARRTQGIRPGIDQRTFCASKPRTMLPAPILRSLVDIGDSRLRDNCDPAWSFDCPQPPARSAPHAGPPGSFLVGDLFDVFRQHHPAHSQPAPGSPHCETIGNSEDLPDSLCLFFAMAGAYIGQNNATELLLLIGFGVFAIIMRFADYPLPPC